MGGLGVFGGNAPKVIAGRTRLNKQRQRQKQARIKKLTEMLPGRKLRPGEADELAKRLGVCRKTFWNYMKEIRAANLCACCGQPLPAGRGEASPLLAAPPPLEKDTPPLQKK